MADYPTAVLEKHWPDVPRWRDIRTLTKEGFYERTGGLRTVDVISGGFPCQPFSVAGKQRGREDERFLWPEMLRVIRELRPHCVVGENVPGIIKISARQVVEDLERKNLRGCVLYATPCQGDAKGTNGTDVSGQLNPEWVEWLMGFPAGWSELEPSAMWSYRSRHTQSSARSPKN